MKLSGRLKLFGRQKKEQECSVLLIALSFKRNKLVKYVSSLAILAL